MDGEMKRKIERAEEQMSEVQAAAREALDNLESLNNELSKDAEDIDNDDLEKLNDYLRGDAYELEQRFSRASETIDGLTGDVEEIYDPT